MHPRIAAEAGDFRTTVRYRAAIPDVYDAVARPGGPRGWWTTRGDVVTRPGEPDEWVGTALRFRFCAEGDATRLDFVHQGLVPELECFAACEGGWDFFLRRSLKQLVELGRGLPYQART